MFNLAHAYHLQRRRTRTIKMGSKNSTSSMFAVLLTRCYVSAIFRIEQDEEKDAQQTADDSTKFEEDSKTFEEDRKKFEEHRKRRGRSL